MRLLKCYRLKKYMVCELSRFRTQLAKKESQGRICLILSSLMKRQEW